MKFHLRKGHMFHKNDHHHLKRKLHHFRGRHFKLMRSMFDGENACKRKFFDGLPKRSMMAGRHHGRKHFKDMRGHSSSDSDDDDDHHHHHGNCHRRGMFGSDDHHGHHHDRGMPGSDDHHGKRMEEQCMRDSIESHHSGMRMDGHCNSNGKENHHGRGHHFRGMHRHGMSDAEESHHGRGSNCRGMQGRCMSEGPHASGKHSKHMKGRCMSEGPRGPGKHFKHMGERCLSEGPHGSGKHMEDSCVPQSPNSSGKHLKGQQERCMSDSDNNHHGKRRHMFGNMRHHRGAHGPGEHHKHMGGRFMPQGPHGYGQDRCSSDSDDFHHGMGRRMRRMMHHHRGRHGMKGHGKRGFFDDDSALVPICAMEGSNYPETQENSNTGNQSTLTEEIMAEEGAMRRDQGTQTTGIMEIVIEDQEALSAAIRIVNKFL